MCSKSQWMCLLEFFGLGEGVSLIYALDWLLFLLFGYQSTVVLRCNWPEGVDRIDSLLVFLGEEIVFLESV